MENKSIVDWELYQKTKNNNFIRENEEQFAVYEIIPQHGSEPNGVILGVFKTKEEAEEMRIKYGYGGENYYVDVFKYD
jgi:hypothetical protein